MNTQNPTGVWLSIETAPKDQRILLGFSKPVFTGVTSVFGSWEDDTHHSKPKPHWRHDLSMLAGALATRANQPTHWMPAPNAPMPRD